ncbi:MAG: aspartate kinase [Actinomycetaceae bacterium]|nr:aspartate kinase [Actinomycetaceae bacterium]
MALIVQKFGGSSVADTASIRRVAGRIIATRNQGHQVVVVVSAMGDTTDELLDMAAELTTNPNSRELDILLTAGERISMSLLAMALTEMGAPASSYTGQQAGIHTDATYGHASITAMVPERIARAIKAGHIAVVAGFQGVNDNLDVTTLGRGGSDTTAVALAHALQADVCEIYTDVDGMFSADPRVVPSSHQLPAVRYEEALELAAHGAKILHTRAVEFARRYNVPLHVRSSFSDKEGTWISNQVAPPELAGIVPAAALNQEAKVEQPIISGIAHDKTQEKITVIGLPDEPGAAARMFEVVANAGAKIGMIVQNVGVSEPGRANISFTLPEADARRALEALTHAKDDLGYHELSDNSEIGILSLVGAGMRSHPWVSAKLFGALARTGVNISMISTSEIRISVVTGLDDLDVALRAVHTAFGLDAVGPEAIVYAGSGR